MGRYYFALILLLGLLYPGNAKRKRVRGNCKEAVDQLEMRFAGMTSSVSGITSRISVLEAGQERTEEAVAANERALDDQNSRITRNADDVSTLKAKNNSLWRIIQQLKSSVWEIMEKLMQLMNTVDSTVLKVKNLTETLNTRCLLFALNDPGFPIEVTVSDGETLSFDEILDLNNVLTDNTTINIRASGRWCCELDIESGEEFELSVRLLKGTQSVPGGFTFIDEDDQGSLHTCFMAEEGDTFQYAFGRDGSFKRLRLVCAIYEYDPFHRE